MGEVIKSAVYNNRPFWLLTIAAIVLIFLGFVVPPMGIIDASVLTAVGELMGFGALWTILHSIEKGIDAKLTHNNTTLEIINDSKDDGQKSTDD